MLGEQELVLKSFKIEYSERLRVPFDAALQHKSAEHHLNRAAETNGTWDLCS